MATFVPLISSPLRIGALIAASGFACMAQTARPIPASFFGATTVQASDYPKFAIGFLAHPPTLAWAWIERSRVNCWPGVRVDRRSSA
jgi:hypothetical protein